MREKVINAIRKHNMIEKGDGIIVGLSGGPDSVSLLHVLNSIREIYNIRLYAVHVNHMIRGEEALRDEEYARTFAESLGVPFFLKRVEVLKFAEENRMSSEEAGRYIRYSFFEEMADKVDANKIALAHNMDDQAETMIMRFLRGSGISGLSGIKPVRDNRYIRPIIECSRSEIEEYCSINGLNPVIDSTNKESIYTRNRIRLEIIPYIKKYFNPNIVESLYKVSEIMRDEDEYLSSVSGDELKRIRKDDGVLVKRFNEESRAIKRRILRRLIEDTKGNLNGVEGKHIDECIEIIERGETGKGVSLPEDLECIIEYDIFKIRRKTGKIGYEYDLKIPGRVTISEEDIAISAKVIDNNNGSYNDTRYIKYFDYDKIRGSLKVRTRQDGDYMYPKGMSGKKKIKDIFIDKKVPRDIRERIPLIAIDREILWIPEIRDTANFKADKNTKQILEIKIERGAGNE